MQQAANVCDDEPQFTITAAILYPLYVAAAIVIAVLIECTDMHVIVYSSNERQSVADSGNNSTTQQFTAMLHTTTHALQSQCSDCTNTPVSLHALQARCMNHTATATTSP
jgi:hypothetical protein